MTILAQGTVFEKQLRTFYKLDDDGLRALFVKSPIKRINLERKMGTTDFTD